MSFSAFTAIGSFLLFHLIYFWDIYVLSSAFPAIESFLLFHLIYFWDIYVLSSAFPAIESFLLFHLIYFWDIYVLSSAFPAIGSFSSSACSTVGSHSSWPSRFNVGASRYPIAPPTMRRRCVGLAVDGLCTGRERLTHSALIFAMLQAALISRGEGSSREVISSQTPTNTLSISHNHLVGVRRSAQSKTSWIHFLATF